VVSKIESKSLGGRFRGGLENEEDSRRKTGMPLSFCLEQIGRFHLRRRMDS
jgi:hypothetical protein